MKPVFGKVIIAFLTLIFSIVTLLGICLIYKSVQETDSSQSDKIKPSNVKVEISAETLSIDISSAIPGVIIFIFGITGLLLLLIKIPVKRIIGYKQPEEVYGKKIYTMVNYRLPPIPVLSERTEKVPLILWWLIKNRGIFQRANK